MAEDDIYGNEQKYEWIKNNLNLLLIEPEKRTDRGARHSKYFCRNPKNLKYFNRLFDVFETRDMSYVRRNRLCLTFRLILTATNQDLAEINEKGDRSEINRIVAFMHQNYKSNESKAGFIKDLKYIWKYLFPEKDEKGRIDDTLKPYVIRHLTPKIKKAEKREEKTSLLWGSLKV